MDTGEEIGQYAPVADDFEDMRKFVEDTFGELFKGVEEASRRPLAEVIAADELVAMEDEDFDEAVWHSLCSRVEAIADLSEHTAGVRMYFATKLIEWEIGNGGFAQAIDNASEFFEEAIAGYRLLDDEASAVLLRRASERSADDDALASMDAQLDAPPWNGVPWGDPMRLHYVRAHRDEFRLQ